MKLQLLSLLGAIATTGIMAGIFFTWSNAVTPGIGRLSDLNYLKALQAMNRAILNLPFYILFIGPVVSLILTTSLFYNSPSTSTFQYLLVASLVYIVGVFLVTILGNIPLNELLDQSNLSDLSLEELHSLRQKIEHQWNNFNWIRTLTSIFSFVLLLMAFCKSNFCVQDKIFFY